MNINKIKKILAKANRTGYGNPSTRESTEPDQSHTITYSEDNWTFHDNYFGGEPFGGREIIHYKGKPVWIMVYYGGILDSNQNTAEVYEILKKALLQFPDEMPLRGPGTMKDGGWEYQNTTTGTFDWFSGEERILYQGIEVYQAKYQGGLVDR